MNKDLILFHLCDTCYYRECVNNLIDSFHPTVIREFNSLPKAIMKLENCILYINTHGLLNKRFPKESRDMKDVEYNNKIFEEGLLRIKIGSSSMNTKELLKYFDCSNCIILLDYCHSSLTNLQVFSDWSGNNFVFTTGYRSEFSSKKGTELTYCIKTLRKQVDFTHKDVIKKLLIDYNKLNKSEIILV